MVSLQRLNHPVALEKYHFRSFLDQVPKNIESLYGSDRWTVTAPEILGQCPLNVMRLYLTQAKWQTGSATMGEKECLICSETVGAHVAPEEVASKVASMVTFSKCTV